MKCMMRTECRFSRSSFSFRIFAGGVGLSCRGSDWIMRGQEGQFWMNFGAAESEKLLWNAKLEKYTAYSGLVGEGKQASE